MLPLDVYRPGTYPPGPGWPQWGDPNLDKAFRGLSEEANANLMKKREDMRTFHTERLQKQGLQQHVLTPRRQPADQPPWESPEEFYDAEEGEPKQEGVFKEEALVPTKSGPSTTEKLVKGAKHVISEGTKHFVKEYAWPATRDILLPAAADAAVGAAVGATKGAYWLLDKSVWTLIDVLWALGGSNAPPPEEDEPPHAALGWSGGSSSSSSGGGLGASGPAQEGEEEADELAKKGKGYLVEEIYKQPGWARMFGREDSRGYTTDETHEFRKKLGKMS